jgi:hypothetical protein
MEVSSLEKWPRAVYITHSFAAAKQAISQLQLGALASQLLEKNYTRRYQAIARII